MTRLRLGRFVGGLAAAATIVACADLLDIPDGRYLAENGGPDAGSEASTTPPSEEGGAPICKGKIYVKGFADFTGPTSAYIAGAWGQIDHYREINANGGILGCPIELEVNDFGYVAANALRIYDGWKTQPEWPEVVTVLGWATPDGVALGPKLKEDKKPLITASYLGRFATPDPVSRQVTIAVVNASFEENAVSYNVKSDGFPYTYFPSTDYSTSARIAMLHAKLLGAKRIGFVRCSDEFCRETAFAAQEYAKRQGLGLGRELVRELAPLTPTGQPVPTGTQQSYEDGIYEYFQQEKARVDSEAGAGRTYQPVDYIFAGNLSIHTAWLANGLKRVKDDPNLGYDVQIIANKQGFDEAVLKFPNCAERVHGVLPLPAYGDQSVPEMSRIMALHDKWRKIDHDAELADGGVDAAGDGGDGGAPAMKSFANGRYVQGYVNMLIFKIAAEKVLRSGKPLTGETLKEALDTFAGVDTGGLTTSLTFTPKDHRPQSTERFYKVSGGRFVLEAERSVVLEDSWLGW
ncbi:MAG: serine/threonine protein kinase [Labilithrix sp.]|nr:serine/threonine protein kinase [Labilithrix sp.]